MIFRLLFKTIGSSISSLLLSLVTQRFMEYCLIKLLKVIVASTKNTIDDEIADEMIRIFDMNKNVEK